MSCDARVTRPAWPCVYLRDVRRNTPVAFVMALFVSAAACRARAGDHIPPGAPGPAREGILAYCGRVVDPDGRPVAGAAVVADDGASYQVVRQWTEAPWRSLAPDPSRAADAGPGSVRGTEPTGADGRFRVEGVRPPAGKGWVDVVHPLFATTRARGTGSAARDGVVDFGDVRLVPGASVRAVVTRPDGAPAAGVWVVARPAAPIEGQGIWWSDETPGAVRAARTDDAGRATVSGLHAARYRVGAFDASSGPVERDAVASRDAPPEVALTLTAGARVRIEAVWRGDGGPVAGARVVIDRVNETGGMSWPAPPPFATLTTSADGVAEATGLPPGERAFDVRITPPDFAADTVHSPGAFCVFRRVDAGATARAELDPPVGVGLPAFDAGTGAKVAALVATARPVWDRYDRTGGDPVELRAEVEDGVALFRTIRAGPWTFELWAPGYLPVRIAAVDVRGSYQVMPRIEMRRATATAAGRVVERSTGRPVAGVRVEAYEWIERMLVGNRVAAETDGDGAFRFAGMLGDGFPLQLTLRSQAHVLVVRAWKKDARAGDLGAIEVVRAGTIRGRVTDRDGRPLAQVEVELVPPGKRHVGKDGGQAATTDADGRYAFTGLAPGEYVVVGQSRSSPIRLEEGGTFECDVVR